MTNASLTEADCRAIDRSDMAALIASWPEQVRIQQGAFDNQPWPKLPAPSLMATDVANVVASSTVAFRNSAAGTMSSMRLAPKLA